MIASVFSVRVSDFIMAMEMPKPTAARERDQLARIDLAGHGADNDDHTDHAEHDGRDLAERHALAEKAGGQDRGPDRHREFDRDHLAQRNQRQREEPADLRGIVNEVAPDMLQRPRRSHRREPALAADQGIQDQQADHRARLHDLKHVQFAQRFAAGDRHDQHQGKPARHP